MTTSRKITTVVSYPSKHAESGEVLKFDMEYYIAKHMPMIEKTWGPCGMQSWLIFTFPDPCPVSGEKPLYRVQTTCYFDTVKNVKLAFERGAGETLPDVVNSNLYPVVWIGETGREK